VVSVVVAAFVQVHAADSVHAREEKCDDPLLIACAEYDLKDADAERA